MVFAVMAVSTVINLFAVIQSAGIDLFGLLKNIEEKQHYTYLSTIGQKNSYSGYLCLLLTRKLPVFAGKTARFKGISKAMIQRPVAEIIFVCAVGLYFFGWKVLGSRIGKYILIVIELAAIGIICAYAVKTTRSFHDKWGTNRGMTWRVGWEQFLQFPLRNKLVGVGPEMLVTVYAKMRAATGRNVVSAHCEPLQVLLTQGIIGLCIYFAFWGYLLKLFFFRGVWKSEKAVYFFPLAAYWGQSIFCSVYPVTAVLFSFAAGMYLKEAEDCRLPARIKMRSGTFHGSLP